MISKAANVSKSTAHLIMCKFELFTPKTEYITKDTPAKIDKPDRHQFKNHINFNGEEYILLAEVQEAISQAAVVTAPMTVIPTIVKNVSVVKHTTEDTIDISLQLKDFETFTIYDLFNFISLGANVGLVFDI